MGSKRTSYLILFALAITWCSLLLAPPLVAVLEGPSAEFSHLAYRFFSRICHQYDSRSLHIFGNPLAVCARCSAIYFGFLGGIFIAALRSNTEWRRIVLWLTLVLLPMLTDVVLDGIGVHASNSFTRISTGLIFGIGSGIVLAPLFADALHVIVSKTAFRSNVVKPSQEPEHAKAG